ncbi:hypothetical protein BH09GEM1_BH09GEM1_00480 [soil metagenome]
MRLSNVLLVAATLTFTLVSCSSESTSPSAPSGIGAAGGTAASSNNAATVVIPAGALAGNTAVTVAPATSVPANAGLVAGSAFNFGPTGTTFTVPVTITIKYDPTTLPANVPESSLRLYTAEGSDWTMISGSTVNATAHTVTGATTHFSTFAPLGVVPVSTVSVTPASAPTTVGATTQLTAVTKDASGATLTGRTVTWATSDATKATVSASGLVTGVALGSATITATSEEKTGTAAVTVALAPVATVTVAPATANVFTNASTQLAATMKDANGVTLNGRAVTWSTSDATKATVNGSGVVSGVAVGSVTITATSETKTGTAAVTVSLEPVAIVTISSPVSNIVVGATAALTATTTNAGGVTLTGRTVTWTSSDPSRATISAAGLVTGVAVGSTTITATSEGISSTATVNVSAASTGSIVPIQLLAITTGSAHACALNAAGAAYCWGYGPFGLGDGTTTDRLTPVAVVGGLTFASVSADFALSCGVTTIGQLYCWGGGSINGPTATPVAEGAGIKFASISAHSNTQICGVATDGTGYCEGGNIGGLLGIGQSQSALPFSQTFLPLAGGLKWKQVVVGNNVNCGIATSGALYCWGNLAGLNSGAGAVSSSATPVLITSAVAFASLSPHVSANSVCGLLAGGEAYCVGSGSQLAAFGGTAGATLQTPVRVAGTTAFKSIAATDDVLCGVATNDGLYCVGGNGGGTFGTGSTLPGSSTTPVLVKSGTSFSALTVGVTYGNVCAVTVAGVGYCWGDNRNGQVGDGTIVTKYAPTAISGGITFRVP